MNPKNSKKSPIHENADANITCDFGDGDISRSRSFLSNTYRRERRPTHPEDGQSRGLLKFISRYAPFVIKLGLEAAESLPAGSDQPWLCWRSLNRLYALGLTVQRQRSMWRLGYIGNTVSQLRLWRIANNGPHPVLPAT